MAARSSALTEPATPSSWAPPTRVMTSASRTSRPGPAPATRYAGQRQPQSRRRRYRYATRPATRPPTTATVKDSQDVARLSDRSEEHTSELQSHSDLVCRLLLEKKKKTHQ